MVPHPVPIRHRGDSAVHHDRDHGTHLRAVFYLQSGPVAYLRDQGEAHVL